MIIGELKEIKQYIGINALLDKAIEIVLNQDLNQFPLGKTEIDEDRLYLVREDYFPRELEECYLEGHEKYIDLQILLEGRERFGYSSIANPNLRVRETYKKEKDMAKYEIDTETIFEMKPNSFVICFPCDLHMPKYRSEEKVLNKKAIFKIKVE